MTLILDSEHHYFWNNMRVAGVNEIKQGIGLQDFSNIPADRREQALYFGRVVHKTCEYDDKKTLDETTIDDITLSYLSGWRKFKKEYRINSFQSNEKSLYSLKYNYAGTLDRVNDNILIDIKTNYEPVKNTDLNMIAYKILYEENNSAENINTILLVHLKPNNYKIENIPASRFREITNDWLLCLQFFKLKMKRRLIQWNQLLM